MLDIDKVEQEAIEFAGDALGRYLDELGITDLAKLSRSQYLEALKVVFGTTSQEIKQIHTRKQLRERK